MRFQIRDDTHGVAVYEARTAREALLDFIADEAKAEYRQLVVTDDEHGAAQVTYDGVVYRAVSRDNTPMGAETP